MSETKKTNKEKEVKEKVSKDTNSRPSMEKRVEELERKVAYLSDYMGVRI